MKKFYVSVKREVVTQIVEFVTATSRLPKFLSQKYNFLQAERKWK
jgi:hypothetical protein